MNTLKPKQLMSNYNLQNVHDASKRVFDYSDMYGEYQGNSHTQDHTNMMSMTSGDDNS